MLSKVGKTPQVNKTWFVFLFTAMHCALLLVIIIISSIAILFVKDQYGTGYVEKGNALAKAYWPYLISDVSSITFLIVSIGILVYLVRMNSERRYNTISGHLIGWFVVTAIMFIHSSLNPIYLTHFSWDWWQYLLRLLPLTAVIYIVYNIIKIVNIELIKAYEADYKFTAEYRRKYLESHYADFLSNERQIYDNYNKNISKWRMFFIQKICHIDCEVEDSCLMTYYREPVLLLKLSQIHYSDSNQSSIVPATNMEIPSTFDIIRIEQDIQLYYFDQELLKEYIYILSTRFPTQNHQDQLQNLTSTYAIDTGLTIEQQNRIEHKMKWRQREAEELWKESEERWESIGAERRLKGDDYINRIRITLNNKRESEERNHLLDEVEEMKDLYDKRKSKVKNDESLTIIERKEQLRILQRTYIAQLDDFERTL